MNKIFFLAWRYIAYHRSKTCILVLGLSLTVCMPLSLHLLIDVFQRRLVARAVSTPLVIGAKGNRYDLVLRALYFRAHQPETIAMRHVHVIRGQDYGLVIPLHLRFTAHKLYSGEKNPYYENVPIVGTELNYFAFRQLRIAQGRLAGMLGECVVGAAVARRMGVRPGDYFLSDQENLYDISANYPLKMPVVGVLQPTGTADDEVVFVDTKTAWVIEGIGHGHQDLAETQDPSLVRERQGNKIVASPKVFRYNEITIANIDSFHFHGAVDEFPLTAIIVAPRDHKAKTLLIGDYIESPEGQVLSPQKIVHELLDLVFRVKTFFDASFVLMTVCVLLFMALVMTLSIRLRQREMQTMFKIGASRRTLVLLYFAEFAIILALSLLLASMVALIIVYLAPTMMEMLFL